MKIDVLTDNNSMICNMYPEHGLSILLQANSHQILLDTGPSGKFMQHAALMNLDLEAVDFAFVSHGHNDHSGGLFPLLEKYSGVQIIAANGALSTPFYSNRNGRKNISTQNDFSRYKHQFIPDFSSLKKYGITILSTEKTTFATPKANATLTKVTNEGEMPDDFAHELILAVEENGKLLVFTGCAHKGILNILTTVQNHFGKQPNIAIGGFHLPDGDFETEQEIQELALQLKTQFPSTHLLTGHYTGEKAFAILQRELGSQLQLFYTGLSINL